jgi:A/G-specific adenine glycosylase
MFVMTHVMQNSKERRAAQADVKWMRRRLLAWGPKHFRNYSWRQDRDLYRSLVTEILLKQTQADRIEAVRSGLFDRFPSPRALGKARLDVIEPLIRKLGFGSQRAVQLKALGKALNVQRPPRRNELSDLPGIGPYSAAATACFVFGEARIALDVNVARIIGRVFGISLDRGELRKNRLVRELGDELIRGPLPRQLNWALLDLGALVCRPRPRCGLCPLQAECQFGSQQQT